MNYNNPYLIIVIVSILLTILYYIYLKINYTDNDYSNNQKIITSIKAGLSILFVCLITYQLYIHFNDTKTIKHTDTNIINASNSSQEGGSHRKKHKSHRKKHDIDDIELDLIKNEIEKNDVELNAPIIDEQLDSNLDTEYQEWN